MFKRDLSTKSGTDYAKYVKERNICTKLLKKTRREHEKNIAKNSKSNPKRFWKYLQERTKSNTGTGTLKSEDGTLASKDADKAETLNQFFSRVFTRENTSNLPNVGDCMYSDGVSISDIRVTDRAVKYKLQSLKPDKAQGPDAIPPRILKEACYELASPLKTLFNESLETGNLLAHWRTA